MAILRHIITVAASLMLTGCYEDFNPEIDTKPVLCLNSLITAGKPIEVEVSRSWMFNDRQAEENHTVTDATVTLTVNDMEAPAGYVAREGDRIRITADSPTYGTATAEVTVPHATPVGAVRIKPVVTDIWKGDKDFYQHEMLADISFNLGIEMEIDDPADTDNYYRLDYNWFSPTDDHVYIYGTLSLGYFEYDSEPIFKEHVGVFETVMGNADDVGFLFFTDRQFAGGTYTLHLNISGNNFSVRSPDFDECLLDCGVNFYLTSVSRSYYNHAVYRWNVEEGIIGDLSDVGLAEPKWGYSNVSTGAGVVAAQSSAKCTVSLTDFLKEALNEE